MPETPVDVPTETQPEAGPEASAESQPDNRSGSAVETEVIYVEDLQGTAAPKKPARPPRVSFRRDALLLDAQDEARDAALLVARESSIGPHAGAKMAGDRLAAHRFECRDLGYPGWFWEVSLARAPRSKQITVCETALVPGPDALLAPAWIPWRDRLEPSDVSRTDVLPYDAHDERLQAGFEEVGADEEELEALGEMGHGRPRVLSQYGLDTAADRWYGSPRGPVPGARADAMCASCGFLLKIKGSMGTLFGVCANEWSPDDGQVVSFDHSCGAHSETDQPKHRSQWPMVPSRIDEEEIDIEEI